MRFGKLKLPKMPKMARVRFFAKQNSPTILVVAGTGLGVISTLLAIKATRKVDGVLEQHVECMEVIEVEDGREKFNTYVRTGYELTKLYLPTILTGTAGIVCILSGHRIISARHAALSTAYSSLHTGLLEYRSRVADKIGKDEEYKLYNNIVDEETEEIVTLKNGKEKVVTKKITKFGEERSPYSFLYNLEPFGEGVSTPSYVVNHLQSYQRMCNDILRNEGILYLNDVYKMMYIYHHLSEEQKMIGQFVGWVCKDHELFNKLEEEGDGYVDFGINDLESWHVRSYIDGETDSLLLDFNVDGNILELLKKEMETNNER